MKITLLAAVTACLAISVQAGGAGGRGGDMKMGPTGNSGPGGRGGNSVAKSGASKATATGNGGRVAGAQTGNTGSGGSGGPITTNNYGSIGPQVVYGNVNGGYHGVQIGTGNSADGARAGDNNFNQNNQNAQANAATAKSTSGAATSGPGGQGGKSGGTGNKISGSKTGHGGQGGDGKLALSIPVPARRSLETRSNQKQELTSAQVVDAIKNNQRLPDPIEAAIDHKALSAGINIPANRKPVNPAYAKLNCDAALAAMRAGQIPPEVQQAIATYWADKKPAKAAAAHRAAGSKVAPRSSATQGPNEAFAEKLMSIFHTKPADTVPRGAVSVPVGFRA